MSKKRLVTFVLCLLLSFNVATLSSANTSTAPSTPVKLVFQNGTEVTVERINEARASDGFAMYTASYGSFSPTFGAETTEYIISDGTVIAVNTRGQHGSYIPKNGYILSASGSATEALSSVAVGQSVELSGMTLPVMPSQYALIGDVVLPIDSVNGFRSTASVVMYQPSFGSSTNTNVWGMEITVVNDKVTRAVSLQGNSPIPSDGYVLSVHIDSNYYSLLNGKVAAGTPVQLSANEVPLYEAVKTAYDAFNPKVKEDNPAGWDDANNQPYPGFRGGDQLIVYDSEYGSSTGTNPWGYEITVDHNGKVISLAGNNSAIPDRGMVLSGHGVKADWLQKHARIGATVMVKPEKKELLLVFTPESYIERAEVNIAAVEQGLESSKAKFLDVPYAQITQKIKDARAKLDQLKTQMEESDYSKLSSTSAEIDAIVNEAYYMNFESRKVEHRGIWVRPLETTAEQVREHVAQIAAANLNTIYLETWWDGYTIFPTENTLTRQNPIYNGFDVLQAYLEEAEKYNIDVHAWVEHFFIGEELALKKPEWGIRNRKGENYETHDGVKWYWLNPALPEARDFVAGIYQELIKKYDFAGLHLDYTRYPESGDYTNDFGYDTYTRRLFEEKYGVDPITLNRGDPLWDEWVDFRVQVINTFVYRIVDEAKALNPDIKISAAVMSDFAIAPEFKLQDAKDWVSKNYIDHLLPMSYTFDVDSVVKDSANALAFSKDKAYVAIGLGPYLRIDKKILAGQIEGTARIGIGGSGMFEFIGFFANRYDKELKLGVYRDTAAVPDRNPAESLRILLNDMKRKINEIYVPNHGVSAGSKYEKRLDHVLSFAQEQRFDAGQSQALLVHLNNLVREISKDAELHTEVKNRMLYDMNYAIQILTIFESKTDKKNQNQ
ncbi:glycoside hydrolase family 10 protein [Cohnella kolymensis]|uniref:glycoside hydrolase family 10 protein n=1 Tax=Cohnella kolymensis TaxID=1590652 RepID=UPI000696CEAF|nr:family 10 glycosylhydrolase [Cohnella kolymensis]